MQFSILNVERESTEEIGVRYDRSLRAAGRNDEIGLDCIRSTEYVWDKALRHVLNAGVECELRFGRTRAWQVSPEDGQPAEQRRHVIRRRFKGMRRKDTKTGLIREIPVPPIVARALARQRALQSADELAAPHGAYRNIDGAVFTDELGRRYTPMAATNAFQRLARKAKLSTTRLHDLRHHAASELLAAGVDPALVAAITGHSIETLLRNYALVRPDAQREKRRAIEKFSARLEAAGGQRT